MVPDLAQLFLISFKLILHRSHACSSSMVRLWFWSGTKSISKSTKTWFKIIHFRYYLTSNRSLLVTLWLSTRTRCLEPFGHRVVYSTYLYIIMLPKLTRLFLISYKLILDRSHACSSSIVALNEMIRVPTDAWTHICIWTGPSVCQETSIEYICKVASYTIHASRWTNRSRLALRASHNPNHPFNIQPTKQNTVLDSTTILQGFRVGRSDLVIKTLSVQRSRDKVYLPSHAATAPNATYLGF